MFYSYLRCKRRSFCGGDPEISTLDIRYECIYIQISTQIQPKRFLCQPHCVRINHDNQTLNAKPN